MTHLPVSRLIYDAAGSPLSGAWAGDVDGDCRLCSARGQRGRAWDEWVRDTFTDHDLVHPGTIVCTACLFCSQERTQMWLAERLGKEKGQRFRNYSHFVHAGVWYCLTKAEKREMRALLMQEPEVAVIADSGQRHLVFRARPGWWQYELHGMRPEPTRLARLLDSVDALYGGGANKLEIASGHYAISTIARIGAPEWRELERSIRTDRGSAVFALAVFLALKADDGKTADRSADGEQLALV